MNKDFILRIGALTDFEGLFDIYMDEKVNRFLNFEIMSKAQFKEIVPDLMKSGELYVYEHKQQIVATCIVVKRKHRHSPVASFETLATHPQFQGKGIGARFMQELIEKMKADGIKRIDLCTEVDNPLALNFYKKLGFQQEGILKSFFKKPNETQYIDEYLLALMIDG